MPEPRFSLRTEIITPPVVVTDTVTAQVIPETLPSDPKPPSVNPVAEPTLPVDPPANQPNTNTDLASKSLDFLFAKKSAPISYPAKPPEIVAQPSLVARQPHFISPRRKPITVILLGIALCLIIALIASPLIAGLIMTNKVIANLAKSAVFASNFDYQSGKEVITLAQNDLEQVEATISLAAPIYRVLLPGSFSRLDLGLNLTGQVVSFTKANLQLAQDLSVLSAVFFGRDSKNWPDAASAVYGDLSLAYREGSLLQAEAEKSSTELPANVRSAIVTATQGLSQQRDYLAQSQMLIRLLTDVFTKVEKQSFLLLIQDETELRPGGGILEAYGVVQITNGRFADYRGFRVDTTDKLLKGEIAPPASLKKYLTDPLWRLRDSTWDPDFVASAKRAQWFIDKETNARFQGTVAINLKALQQYLEIIGPVTFPSGLEVTSANFLTTYLATKSVDKPDFLVNVTSLVVDKLKSSSESKSGLLAKLLIALLQSKDILFQLNADTLQKAIASAGWDGGIRSYNPIPKAQPVMPDYLYLNEANLTLAKTSQLLNRRLDHRVSLDTNGKLIEKLTISLENLATEGDKLTTYKALLRLYLPQDVTVDGVLINDVYNPGLWLPQDSKNLEVGKENGKTVVQTFLEIPSNTERKLEISYSQQTTAPDGLQSYLLFVQKQPGFSGQYQLTFTYPENMVPLRVIPSAIIGKDQLLLSQTITGDQIIQIDLAKQD